MFFRASTVQEGDRLGLVGYARNLADGRVEVLARGSADRVDALGRWLNDGPPMAVVTDIVVHDEDPATGAELTDFRTG